MKPHPDEETTEVAEPRRQRGSEAPDAWRTREPGEPERGILIGAVVGNRSPLDGTESLAELERLAETAGVVVVGKALQNIKRIHAATFIGSGKAEEIQKLAEELNANVALFDDSLSPAQQRNLEKTFKMKVLDRSALILDIFAQRARSLEGKLQVELAQLEYMLPRLTRAWTHLSRQAGGGVGTRGPGETQLEVDRRRVRERVSMLKKRLADAVRTRSLHRDKRTAVPYPLVALVGYTNSGKSTLMNRLTEANVLAEDKLFATLDPTTRRLELPNGTVILLSDTVGFITKLPHGFIDAFKSTLEEVRAADLLLHVVDVTDPQATAHIAVVDKVLEELGAQSTPRVMVWNKIDALPPGSGIPAGEGEGERALVSARTGVGLPDLLNAIAASVKSTREQVEFQFPVHRQDLVATLHREGSVLSEEYEDDAIKVTALVTAKVAGQVRKSLSSGKPAAA